MAVVDVPLAPPDAGELHRLIRGTRFLLRTTRLATGLALTVGLFLGALALVTAADLLLPLLQLPYALMHGCDVGLRISALCLVIAPTALAFLIGVLFPLVRRLTAGQVARRIEAHLPGIHNRLVSCIDLEKTGRAASSPVFYRRLVAESLDRIRGFRPGRVLDFVGLRRAVLTAVVGAAAFVLVCYLFWAQLPTAMARVFRPFDDVPPVGAAAYTVQPKGGDFLRQDKIDFSAHVTRGRAEALTLEMRADNGAVHTQDLEAGRDDASTFGLQLDTGSIDAAFQDGFDYRVYGAGTWSDRYHVRLLPRPLVKAVKTAVYYPAYMGIPEPQEPKDPYSISGPEGGEIEAAITVEGQVKDGVIQLLKPGLRKIPASEQTERVWFKNEPPAGAAADVVWGHEDRAGRAAHTDAPSGQAPHRHGFQGDANGFFVNKGDALFAYVFIDPQQPPEEIMLQWNDGKSWEHRAFWGAADFINEGQSGPASCLPIDPVPDAGRWVRLEAPAAALGLEGVTVHGMEFVLKGGRCWWGESGAVRLTESEYQVDRTFPMHAADGGQWVGRLPLTGEGAFRAEFHNDRGDANTPMMELHYSAVKDLPPTITLVQPQSKELMLNDGRGFSLTAFALDDFGLADVKLYCRPDGTKDYDRPGRVVRRFDQPERSQTVVASFDELADLKKGTLVYCLEATDRKGQTARTPEAKVTINPDDANAVDRPKADFDKAEDTFHDRLVQLIATQKTVQANVEKTTAKYAEAADKVRQAQEAAAPTPPADPTKPPMPPKDGPKIDPELMKQMAELQKQLGDLAREQDKNAQAAAQLNNDLAKAADQADKMQTLPQPLVQEMQSLQKAFEQTAVRGMQNLTQQFNQGASPQAPAPDLHDLNQKTDRLTKDLEGLKGRMDALDNARKGLREDLAKALQDLQRQMLEESGKLSERDLQDLRDFLNRLREQMKDLQNQQQQLAEAAEKGGDMKDIQAKQEDLDKQMEKVLEAARKMLDAHNRPHPHPHFPDEPYTPDGDDVKAPPKDEDSNTPLPNAKKPDGKNDPNGDKKPDDAKDDDKDPLDMPALGGPKQVPDPRYDKKRRPAEKKPGDKDDADKRDDLESHQNDRMRDLDTAEKSLASDQQTLDQMLKNLDQALQNNGKQGKPQSGQPNEADEAMQQLQDMLQSPAMRAARDMLGRMRRAQAAQARQPGQQGQNQSTSPSQSATSVAGSNPTTSSSELAGLPPDTRQAILRLPPRDREAIMQGLRQRGPDGYGPFIEDYFKRLTESKNP